MGTRWRSFRAKVFALDSVLVFVGLLLACLTRYDGDITRVHPVGVLVATVVAVAAFAAASLALRLHQGRYVPASSDESAGMAAAAGAAAVATLVVVLISGSPRLVPLSVPPAGAVVTFVLMLSLRYVLRRRWEERLRPLTGRRTLIFGGGVGGHQLIWSMQHDSVGPYLPVGLLDDDPCKRHARIEGVRMLGGRDDIETAARVTGAEVLVIAIPSASAALVRDISRRAAAAGLAVKVLPRMSELVGSLAGIRDIRDIDIADLLGRHQIDTDMAGIASYIVGRRVLVTGAGGSIGSELCVQLSRFGPSELIMVDRDESALHALQLRLHGEARLELPEVVLLDIRDTESVDAVFRNRRPEVVFHAAALKHVNMLEQYPDEAWKTNVLGTRNVLEASIAVDVSHFINISTDKAADPVNVLGTTKRIAERLTAAYAQRSAGEFLSVRFGNVLGSRGSVLTTFAAQIARGGPVTVTDPDVTRYFMTIPEAVQLVVQAGALGSGGEVLVLDMGRPVKIADVARQLVDLCQQPIEIVYTGLRPGEKNDEVLFGTDEIELRPVHPLITAVPVPPLDDWVLANMGRRASDLLVWAPLFESERRTGRGFISARPNERTSSPRVPEPQPSAEAAG
ncbi:polysaccharide biosynthesis protein [Geodermatophilus sp. SYSU D00815]